MGFWDLFKKKKAPEPAPHNNINSKEDIFKMVFEQMAQKTPSEHFASGAVFDFTRQLHEPFEKAVRSNNALELHQFFTKTYVVFCNNPQTVGMSPSMVNTSKNDTNPGSWNADTFTFENGDAAALCYMPIQHDSLAARLIGIILSDKGDGYYYCMLNKDENVFSEVKRNKAMFGIAKAGEVKGRGFDLMNDFLECMKKDFYSDQSSPFF